MIIDKRNSAIDKHTMKNRKKGLKKETGECFIFMNVKCILKNKDF